MNTLVRNTTLRFSRRFDHGFLYGPVDEKIGEDNNCGRISSSRRKVINNQRLRTCFSYRRDRAKKRQIFLQSYKLGSDTSEKICKSRKLKKAANKVKSVAVSVVSFTRISSLIRSYNSIRAFSPTRIRACCWGAFFLDGFIQFWVLNLVWMVVK